MHLLSSESNEVCEKNGKKTIAPDHVLSALRDLGFEGYVAEVEEVLKEHTVQQKVSIASPRLASLHRSRRSLY